MGKFVITTRKDGQFQFSLKAGNGQTILRSEAYTTKAACMNGVESVMKNGTIPDRFERSYTKEEKPYFRLKAGNGQYIGTSSIYESEASLENSITSVMINVINARIDDETEV